MRIILLSVLLLVGCASSPVLPIKPISNKLVVPKVLPTELKPVTWTTVNNIYSLDKENMKLLIGNLDELKRYIVEQKAVIDFLTEATENK